MAVYSFSREVKLPREKVWSLVGDFTKAIELNPNNAEVYIVRGGINDVLQKYDESLQDLEKAIELNPDYESELRVIINEIMDKMK